VMFAEAAPARQVDAATAENPVDAKLRTAATAQRTAEYFVVMWEEAIVRRRSYDPSAQPPQVCVGSHVTNNPIISVRREDAGQGRWTKRIAPTRTLLPGS
jgi:hypothetical protein